MKTAKRAWLFFALCCIFLMGSSFFRTGIIELKIASSLSPLLSFSEEIKRQLHYIKLSLIAPEQIDQIAQENRDLKSQRALEAYKNNESFPLMQSFATSRSKIYLRPLERWSSSMWIQRPTVSPFPVEEDCPVVSGNQLLGLVEKVEGNACFVRLLGDPQMKVSVELAADSSLAFANWHLKTLRGDVEGMEPPYWGESNHLVKGQLFLHPQDRLHLQHPIPLQKMADDLTGCLLITSGLDGAFPKGLIVGKIAKVFTPLEGDCVFKFEAVPLDIWDDLFLVTVLQKQLQRDF